MTYVMKVGHFRKAFTRPHRIVTSRRSSTSARRSRRRDDITGRHTEHRRRRRLLRDRVHRTAADRDGTTATELVDYFHLAFTPEPVEAPPEVVTTEAEGNTPGIYGVWSYKVRDIANNYVADLGDIFTVTTVDTKNEVGTWTATIPVDAVAAPYLITPGNGIVELLDGEIVFSGPMDDYRLVDDETGRRYEVSGKSDAVHLQDRLAVPNPDDLRTVGGVMPYPPVADSARTGLTGIPDNTNLYNDLKADEFSDTVGVVSQAGQTMSYRGVGSIPTGLLNPFRITGVRVRAIGRCDSGVDNALFAYIRVGGVDYLGLHWISLSGSPSEASGTWLDEPGDRPTVDRRPD
jgi:hypothetical protein